MASLFALLVLLLGLVWSTVCGAAPKCLGTLKHLQWFMTQTLPHQLSLLKSSSLDPAPETLNPGEKNVSSLRGEQYLLLAKISSS